MPETIKLDGMPEFPSFAGLEVDDTPIETRGESTVIEPEVNTVIEPEDIVIEDDDETPIIEDTVEDNLEESDSTIEYVKNLVEMGLLNAPEGFKAEDLTDDVKIQELMDYDNKVREETAFNNLKQKIADQRVLSLLEHAMKGGQFADVEQYFQLQQEEEFKDITFSTDEDRASFVKDVYISKGIPAKRAEMLVTALAEEGELDAEADTLKLEISAGAAEKRKTLDAAAREAEKEREQKAQEWREGFYKGLDNLELNPTKRSQIQKQFDNVRFQDGTTLPKWQYQFYQIQQNPEAFIRFLELVSYYDSEKGFQNYETAVSKKKNTAATTSLAETLRKKAQTMKGGSSTSQKRGAPISNPVDRNVTRL